MEQKPPHAPESLLETEHGAADSNHSFERRLLLNNQRENSYASATPKQSRSHVSSRKSELRALGLFPAFSRVYIVPSLLLLVTLPFGSVHHLPYTLAVIMSVTIALSLIIGRVLSKDGTANSSLVAEDDPSKVSFFILLALLSTLYVGIHSLMTDKTLPLSFLNYPDPLLSESTSLLTHPIDKTFHRSLLAEFFEHFIPSMSLVLGGFVLTYLLLFLPRELLRSRSRAQPLNDSSLDARSINSSGDSDENLGPLQLLVLVGASIGLVALSSWLTDNGKLFWIFQAEYDVPSPRARWPFVNPNHLGFFLLPFFFLSLSLTIHRALLLFTTLSPKSNRRHNREKFAELLGRQSTQRQIAACGITLLFTVIMLIGVIATLSRACWIGLLVGLGVFMVLNTRSILSFESASQGMTSKRSRRPSSSNMTSSPHYDAVDYNAVAKGNSSPRERSSSPTRVVNGSLSSQGKASFSLMLMTSVILVVCVMTFFLFSAGEGKNHIESRFVYGLTSSHDDMRWELFTDSLPLITFWGSGVSQWDELYRTVQSVEMTGLEPVYLHSEPLQVLIELGVPGLLLLSLLFLCAPFHLFRALRKFRQTFHPVYPLEFQRKLALEISAGGLLAGWSAITVALFFDFATRIPANLLLLAVLAAVSFGYAGLLTRGPLSSRTIKS